MRLLVTGGAGYVGSHVVRALLDAGHEPVVFDNLSTGHSESVPDAELVVGDLSDRDRLEDLLSRMPFDGVIHLAAHSVVSESVKCPARYFRNNVSHTLGLFESLLRFDVGWIVFSSTAAVYGNPAKLPISEQHALDPTNPYGESKLMVERVLAWYERAYGFRSGILRYFNAAGAHPSGAIGEDHSPETHLLPVVLQVALGLRPVVNIYGCDYSTPDGTAIRDYVHVCDLADAHVRLADRLIQGCASSCYNLGNQRGHSVMEVVEAARQVTDRKISVEVKPRRAGDPPILVADSTRARVDLKWIPKFGLHEIVETAWIWHRAHPGGYAEG